MLVMVIGCTIAAVVSWSAGPYYDPTGWIFVIALAIISMVEDTVAGRREAVLHAEAVVRGARLEAGIVQREQQARREARDEEAMLWWETLAGVDAVAPMPDAVRKWQLGLHELAKEEGKSQGLAQAADMVREAIHGKSVGRLLRLDTVASQLDILAGRPEKPN
jgi:hypothetical protein